MCSEKRNRPTTDGAGGWGNPEKFRNKQNNGRLKKSNKTQQYADIYLLLNYSTCFGRPSRPSSGVHKTVVAASGTDHTVWGASFFRRDQIRTFEEARSPDSTICTRGCYHSLCTPDDGRDGRPKHVK